MHPKGYIHCQKILSVAVRKKHFPGGKNHANARLTRALAGTTQLRAVAQEMLAVLRPVTLQTAATNSTEINDNDVSMV